MKSNSGWHIFIRAKFSPQLGEALGGISYKHSYTYSSVPNVEIVRNIANQETSDEYVEGENLKKIQHEV
jgi:hypothetical protein